MKTALCGLMLAGVTSFNVLSDDAVRTAQPADAATQKQSIAEGEKKLPLPSEKEDAAGAISTNKPSSIIGKRVYDTNGTELGRVQDLVVDMEKGELGYVVLEVKTEDGPRKLPVPSRALKTGEQPDTLVLNISEAVLAATEVYRDEELPDANAFSVDAAVGGAAASEQGSGSSEEKRISEQPKKIEETRSEQK